MWFYWFYGGGDYIVVVKLVGGLFWFGLVFVVLGGFDFVI